MSPSDFCNRPAPIRIVPAMPTIMTSLPIIVRSACGGGGEAIFEMGMGEIATRRLEARYASRRHYGWCMQLCSI